MAVTSGFYNSLNGDRKYDAIQFGSMFDGIIEDGIFETYGGAMMVSAEGGSMVVKVAVGRAWFDHSWILNDSILNIELDPSELVLDRIDAVVIETDSSEAVRNNTIKIIKGTPASIPVKPNLTRSEDVNQYALAYITIPAESTEITTLQIENAVGVETPFVIGVLQTLDASDLITQWQAQFGSMMTEDQAEFLAWFNEMKDQLSEDAAGQLQLEINELDSKVNEINTFNVSSSLWTNNSDPLTSARFPKVANISSDKYTNNSAPIWQMEGAGNIPTEAEFDDINLVLDAWFDTNGIILYATDAPANDLRVTVKGV